MFEAFRRHIETKIELSDDEFARLSSHFSPRRLTRKEALLQQGDVCRYESFVVSGCLKTYHTDENAVDHILRFSIENWWAGDLGSFLHNTPSALTIEALEPTTLLVIDKPSLEKLYQQLPNVQTFFKVLNENALIATSQRLMHNLSLPASERYALFLNAYPQIARRIPLKDLAAYLGITPVFLSKLRRKPTGQ
ncbi:Crp/Fnr family transcriptional regulator [Spirosoma koreense]